MKYYGNKETGALVPVKRFYSLENFVEELGYTDFTGKGQYNTEQYYVLRKKEQGQYVFKKTLSLGKINGLTRMGWELIKEKDTHHVAEKFIEEVGINE
ncbi:MAG: hypothetical protein N2C11_10155 [Planococcus sp. (in: firmicutes)]|uniref:hypothetical protein n=1 Tax=Planococcus halocryophilus TaxID=1215089 RepID=UPI001F0D60E3|nr:hypothetical protein [Planococcus halocryophilus]MCH4828064.1 hypothetical protein [Planococcus halocryophilus]